MHTYNIDKNDNIVEVETSINKPWVCLSETEVEFLVKMLKNKHCYSILTQLDYLRDDLSEIDGISLLTYYSLVRAIFERYFKTDFKIKEPKYYVHILPSPMEYLNMRNDGTFSITTPTEMMGTKTKFTMSEIEKNEA